MSKLLDLSDYECVSDLLDDCVSKIINDNGGKRVDILFNKEKAIKRIMQLESEMFMPKHKPKGTPEDPDNPDYREFTQEEKDNCTCPNCKFPYEYWNKKTDKKLQMDLASLEKCKVDVV